MNAERRNTTMANIHSKKRKKPANKNIITMFESVGITSTQENLFVGTREECDQYIVVNELLQT